MNEASRNIVAELTSKLSLQNKTKEEVATLVKRYPYFGFTQFLLAQKLSDEQDGDATKQLQHAALYFSNLFWMDYLWENNTLINDSNTIVETAEDNNSPADESVRNEVDDEMKAEKSEEEPDLTDIIVDETLQGSNDEITFESSPETDFEEEIDEAEREKLSKLIEQHLSEFKKPVDGTEEIPISTRVYHAIDYFASQGIKLDPRLLSQDMLGNKVRKFTDWLKQMKRINENPTDLGTDADTEHLIEKIAQSSNEAKDVITETMAEVLKKQGKKEKAIQLYQKLSFLNPSKSIYFAAKINELKSL
jgi:hypothetical protein